DFTVTGTLTSAMQTTGSHFAIVPSGVRSIHVGGNFSAENQVGVNNYTFGNNNLTIWLDGAGDQSITQGASGNNFLYSNIRVDKTSGEVSLLSNLTLSYSSGNNLVIQEGIFSLNGWDLSVTPGTITVESGGLFKRQGGETSTVPILQAGSKIVYSGDGDAAPDSFSVLSAGFMYQDLVIDSIDGTMDAFSTSGNLDVNGTFRLQNGAFIQGAADNVNIAGNVIIDTGTVYTKSSGSGVLTFDGDLTFADNTSPQQDLGRLVIGSSPDTTTLTTDLTATSLLIDTGDALITDGYEVTIAGTVDINGTLDASSGTDGNSTITVGGLWDMTGGVFTNTNSTVIFDGTMGAGTYDIISDTKSFNNLTISDTGSDAVWVLNDNLVVTNDIFVVAGTLDLAGFDATVTDQFDVDAGLRLHGDETVTAATFTIDSSTSSVQFYNGAVTATITNYAQVFHNLILGAGKTHEIATGVGNGITINGTLDSNGSSGSPSVLRSVADAGVDWELNLQGVSNLQDKVDVKRS
ncbi:MAG: hypothetical protein K8I00_09900, partial [Candidatus Omnitrophica bacterium]|nr:hypothetical protein [Candidatus Omnitrophota bacterium]